jgi:hypothetical protein
MPCHIDLVELAMGVRGLSGHTTCFDTGSDDELDRPGEAGGVACVITVKVNIET